MKNAFLVPISIVVAGAIVAGAIFFSKTSTEPESLTTSARQAAQQSTTIGVRPVDDNDFIRGPRDARVTIIEFSDTECPFCKRFHSTLKQIRDEYPDDVAWVYRHFPIVQLHAQAPKEAEALECAGELGGNDTFWAYTDRLYEITPGNDGLDLAQLPEIAEFVGLDREAFTACLDSGRMAERVQEDLSDARTAAEDVPRVGTPFSIIVSGETTVPIVGAQPIETIRATIDGLL